MEDLTEPLPATFSSKEIEDWMNGCIKDAIENFNLYIVADLEDGEEVYLNVPEQEPIKLTELDEKWVGESFVLEGENPFEDNGRLYQLRNPFE